MSVGTGGDGIVVRRLQHRVLLFPDSGRRAGFGHVGRCIALAQAFISLGWDPVLVIEDAAARRAAAALGVRAAAAPPSTRTLAVVDSYMHMRETLRALRPNSPVAAIDDMHELTPRDVDALIRPSIAEPERNGVLAGSTYVLLRKEYWRRGIRRSSPRPRRVFLSLGGYPDPQLIRRALRAIRDALPSARVDVASLTRLSGIPTDSNVQQIVGALTLHPWLRRADLAVTGGGQTLNEALATGVPTLVLGIAENQRRQVDAARRAGATALVGWRTDSDWPSRLHRRITDLAGDQREQELLSVRGRRLVDGRGACRLAQGLIALALDPLRPSLRPPTAGRASQEP